MGINDLIAQANQQAAAQTEAQPQVQQEIVQPQVQQEVQPQVQPAANPLAGMTPEQIAAIMAMVQQQAAPAQAAPVQQYQAPVQQEVQQYQAPQQQFQAPAPVAAVDPELARFMVGNAPSIANTSVGMFAVDAWLKPSFAGMTVNDVLVKPFKATLDLNEKSGVTPAVCMRYNVGDTAQYIKSYDGVTTSEGIAWADAVRQAINLVGVEKLDRPYNSFDLVVIAAEDVVSMQTGDVIVKAGTALGHATPVTGTSNMVQLIDKAIRENKAAYVIENGKQVLQGQNVTVTVENEAKSKGSQRKWGVLKFALEA